jgi:hypothetical protein
VIVYPKLKAIISGISTFGDLSIKFSEKTKIEMNMMELELIPYDLPEGIDLSKLKFVWEAKSFDGVKLELKINFTNPAFVSPNKVQDSLIVRFQNVSYITAVETGEPLDEKSWVLATNIKK